MKGSLGALEEGGPGRRFRLGEVVPRGRCKACIIALGVRCSLLETPLHIQVTSPIRPSGPLSHDAVNYVRKEKFVSCGYVFSLLKLDLKE